MAYVKSLFWLLGSGAIGYTLFLVTTPNEQIVSEKYNTDSRTSETLKKKQALLDTLRLAAESKNPMYRQSKEQIDSDLQKK